MGPIEATPLNVNAVTCKEKALLSVKIAPSSRECQKTITCKIDSGDETNIVPRSLYNQTKYALKQPFLRSPQLNYKLMEGQKFLT